ncbi:Helix-turn-helix domain-containing protein [Marininema mesophilum]|uniref:Helix-turn-helix domain-containing protein n=1 Tax=Marininema mesophilum TaxID=1048340 RepID=A0A1H2ZC67_9BACL|nr:helix-turn-helix transcriptional regulator [Marininema mesophilum]SDX14981.1 Helix-turn-helix domain-containing protein [Marininema mesophilum]
MLGIGSQLKKTRQSKGYSLEQVQESTKIHMEYLRALENDQFDTLPSPFYVRAFLRTYAHSLGLDAQPLLDYYEGSAMSSRIPRRGVQPKGRSVQGGTPSGQAPREFRPQPRLGRNYAPRSQRMSSPQMEGQTQNFRHAQQQPGAGRQPTTGSFRAASMDNQPTQPSQSSQRIPSVSQTSQPVRQQSTSPVPAVSQTTMVPRRVQQEVKRGIVQGDGDPKKKNKGRKTWMVRVAAVGALLLVTVGALAVFNDVLGGTGASSEKAGKKNDAATASSSTANAKTPETTTLSKVETGNDVEGDLYTLKGAKKIEVEIKAVEGESSLTYGTQANNQKENFTLKVGEKRSIDGDKFIWFRLFKPSNTEIKVNGEEIDTTAQDVPKSYRIKLKK